MRLTKKLKHSIYVEALKIFKEYDLDNRLGLCSALSDALRNLNLPYTIPDPYCMMDSYPEIYKHEPIRKHSFYNWFNFSSEGIEKRIAILEQAIKETRGHEKKTTKTKN